MADPKNPNANPRKVALVTGASGGIGRAVAARLASDGLAVAVHYAGKADRAHAVVGKIQAGGGRTVAVRANVADATDVVRLFRETADVFGRVDVVVHTAGVRPLSPMAAADVAAFDRMITTNLRGTFLVLGQALRANGGFA
jgi:3-oxoacyl-[acyl-carrier protein] reductase